MRVCVYLCACLCIRPFLCACVMCLIVCVCFRECAYAYVFLPKIFFCGCVFVCECVNVCS